MSEDEEQIVVLENQLSCANRERDEYKQAFEDLKVDFVRVQQDYLDFVARQPHRVKELEQFYHDFEPVKYRLQQVAESAERQARSLELQLDVAKRSVARLAKENKSLRKQCARPKVVPAAGARVSWRSGMSIRPCEVLD